MGMRPIALARKKQPGSIGSCIIADLISSKILKLTIYVNMLWLKKNQNFSYLHDDQDINWIIVLTESTWNKTIIVRVHN